MSEKTAKKRGILSRLRTDKTANTLALGTAAIFPLIGIIGGGLDISRAYMVKARIQLACDAATLAARKQLADGKVTSSIPTEVQNAADSFFKANFQTGDYGTENGEFTLSAGTETRMDGTASVDVPMSLMKVFGYEKMEVSANCSAELNLPNIDVMLVLDHSGSMRSGGRMDALRDAVFSFYDEVHAVKPANARVRIGVVPYSGTVNVGRVLYDANPDWIANSWTYQSREANFETITTPGEDGEWEEYSYARENVPYEISDWGNPGASDRWPNNNAADRRCNDMGTGGGTEYMIGDERWVVDSDHFKKNYYPRSGGWRRSVCDLRIRKFRRGDPSEPTTETVFRDYTYKPMVFDTSAYKTFARVSTPTGREGAMVSSRWNGCIEERQTVANTDWSTIPADAYDMNINLVPNPADPATQWKPQWEEITYARRSRDDQRPDEWTTTRDESTHSYNCPSEAIKLREFPTSGGARNPDFESYINNLSPNGGTMHNIGMIWAARFISSESLFASENEAAPNGDPISRHILFMTDGQMGADPRNYIAYGNVNMDGRFMGFKASGNWRESDTIPVNNARLEALCERVKNQNITVWTVIFDPAGSIAEERKQFVRACASGESRTFDADNSTELAERFRRIATSIAELRLVR